MFDIDWSVHTTISASFSDGFDLKGRSRQFRRLRLNCSINAHAGQCPANDAAGEPKELNHGSVIVTDTSIEQSFILVGLLGELPSATTYSYVQRVGMHCR